jgi:small GTP-binding protein
MDPTIGQTFLKSTIRVESEEVTLHLWDTPGSERYASANSITIRDAHCCVIVYDVSDPESKSYALIPSIIDRYESACGKPGTFVVVVGNKCDAFPSHLQEAEVQRLEDAHTEFRVKSFLTSAKTGEGVQQLFTFVASELLARSSERIIEEIGPGVDLAKGNEKKDRGGCC